MKKIFIRSIIAIIVLVVIVVFFLSRSPKQHIGRYDVIMPGNLTVVLKETGIIKPQVGAMISIGARVTGILEEVNVKVGDRVKKGELVARIDSRTITQNIKQAEDNLQKAREELDKTMKLYPLNIEMQENNIESARSNYEYLTNIYEREKVLYDKGYSRKETLDQARHNYISSKAEYEKQKIQLKYMKQEFESSLVSLRAEIRRQQSILDEQKINLTYTEIFSPIDGIVSSVKSVEGETIVAGLEVANIITITRPELLEMFIYVDESDIGIVKNGMNVTYKVDTFPNKKFSSTISRINLQPEVRDGVTYYVSIANITTEEALLLRPEMTANVDIYTLEKDVELSIINSAIKWEDGQQIAYKIIDEAKDITVKVPLELGIRGEERSEIISGLSAGDKVVISFEDKMHNSNSDLN